MTNTNQNEGFTAGDGLKLAWWIVLGVIILVVVGSIILFLLQLVVAAVILAFTAFVGWLVWIWLKSKWEKRQY